jgi:hypothetical protein
MNDVSDYRRAQALELWKEKIKEVNKRITDIVPRIVGVKRVLNEIETEVIVETRARKFTIYPTSGIGFEGPGKIEYWNKFPNDISYVCAIERGHEYSFPWMRNAFLDLTDKERKAFCTPKEQLFLPKKYYLTQ